MDSRLMFAAAAGHCVYWSDERGFPGRRQGRRYRDTQAAENCQKNGVPGERDRPRTAADVERFDGGSNQLHGETRQKSSQSNSNDGAEQTEPCSLAQESGEHAGASCAESAQNADLIPAANDGYRNGVVDEKRAHHEGDVTQDPEIPAKGGEHPPVLAGVRALTSHNDAGRKRVPKNSFPVFERAIRRSLDENTVEQSVAAQQTSGWGEVHDDSFAHAIA